MRTSLGATHHGIKDWLPLFLAKDLSFWFMVSFGKFFTRLFHNEVLNIVFQRWCIFPHIFSVKRTINFRFSMYVFCADFSNFELFHGSDQGKESCDCWSPVNIIIRWWSCCQRVILMVVSLWRIYPVYEDLFMFDFWLWCCWWLNCFIFNCGFKI